MKKFIIGILMMIGVVITLAGCNTEDKVTDVDYKYSIQDAAKIYQEETGETNVKSILFDTVDHRYQYIVTNEQDEQIIIDPQNGSLTQRENKGETNDYQSYNLNEVEQLKPVNKVLSEAKEKVGGLSPRTLTWELVKENDQLKFKIDVKTTTADEWVEISAN